jgi:hypothetical protein
MEIFSPDREGAEAVRLTKKLKRLGIGGRDAAYLASVDPTRTVDDCVRANYRKEFRFMVARDQRAEAARLIGLAEW